MDITTQKKEQRKANLSPLIANIYMHYMLTLWFYKVFKQKCRGYSSITVYADDFVGCFQYKGDADMFNELLKERLEMFGLELEPSKTRLIEFGKYAEANRKKRKQGRPETFDFLGFTHYCSKSRKGWFRVKKEDKQKEVQNQSSRFQKLDNSK